MKTKKIILIAVAVAVVAGGGIWFFRSRYAGIRYH